MVIMLHFDLRAPHCGASYTVGRVLIAWFNDYVLGKSGQIANPIIAMVDPILYNTIRSSVKNYVLALFLLTIIAN